MMRRDALAMGAAVLAAVPVVVSCPVSASAEYLPSWEQWRELYDYNLTDPVVTYLYTDDVIAPYWRYYASAVMAVVEGVYINGNYAITPSDFQGISGYYLLDGAQRFGSIYANGIQTVTASSDVSSDLITLVSLQDGTLALTLTPESGTNVEYTVRRNILSGGFTGLSVMTSRHGSRLHTKVYFDGTGIFTDVWYNITTAYDFTVYIRCNPLTAPAEFTTTGDYITTSTSSGRVLLGNALNFSSLPISDTYPTITSDNALDYISDVLNPYMVENVPDLEPYLYNPHVGEPIFPTGDTVSGMPKEWTIKNPALPSYNLDLQLPTADYSTVDVATPIEQNASGIRFWWAMFGTLLDHFGLKSLVVLACALGLFLLILTRLGR